MTDHHLHRHNHQQHHHHHHHHAEAMPRPHSPRHHYPAGGDVTNPVRVTRITAMATRGCSYFDSNRFGRRAHSIVRPCPFKISSPAYEINGQGSHALGSYLHEDGSPECFLDHTQVAQVCQAELQVAVINNSQWCAPVFGMCSTSCSSG